MSRARSNSDPLTAAAAPPVNETLQEKDKRIRAEIEAKKISDAIDEAIKQEIGEGKDIVSVLSECFCLIATSVFRGADAVDGVQ